MVKPTNNLISSNVPSTLPLGCFDLRTGMGVRAYVDLQNPSGVSGNFSAGLQAECNLGGANVERVMVPRHELSNASWQPPQMQTRYRFHLMTGYQVWGVPFGVSTGTAHNFNNVISVGVGFQIARFTGVNPFQLYSSSPLYSDPNVARPVQAAWASTFRLVGSYNFEGNIHAILSAEYRQQFRFGNGHWGFDALLGLDAYLREGLPALGAHAELGVGYYF